MHGLTIRWSLLGAAPGTADRLRDYVRDESVPRFAAMPELHSKVWQLVDAGFFAGTYVWRTEAARQAFLEGFRADPSRVSQIVGDDPESVQEWEVVAMVAGGEVQQPVA